MLPAGSNRRPAATPSPKDLYASFTSLVVSFTFRMYTQINWFCFLLVRFTFILCWGSRIVQVFLHSMQPFFPIASEAVAYPLGHYSFVHPLQCNANLHCCSCVCIHFLFALFCNKPQTGTFSLKQKTNPLKSPSTKSLSSAAGIRCSLIVFLPSCQSFRRH